MVARRAGAHETTEDADCFLQQTALGIAEGATPRDVGSARVVVAAAV